MKPNISMILVALFIFMKIFNFNVIVLHSNRINENPKLVALLKNELAEHIRRSNGTEVKVVSIMASRPLPLLGLRPWTGRETC